jgi:enoyl reductase
MRAIVYDRYGPPEVLRLAQLDAPHPRADQVRVRVYIAGVNPVDAKQRRGDFAGPDLKRDDFPKRLGNEYAGVIDAVGSDVSALAVGDEVLGSTVAQAYSELIVVDAADVVLKPTTLSWEAAGALPAAGQTAVTALQTIRVGADDTVIIHGAAGGVGTVAIQLACLAGTTVIGTASEANHDYLRHLGAIPVTYGAGLVERVAQIAPRGIDAALDLVGGEAIAASLELVPDRGRIATTVDRDAAATHGLHRAGARSTEALRAVVRLASAGDVVLTVDATLGLAEAVHAHRRIEAGHATGKTALRVA